MHHFDARSGGFQHFSRFGLVDNILTFELVFVYLLTLLIL
jgi:hypothetical protein